MLNALIIVDVQNDFVEGGSLAVKGGIDLARRLAEFLETGGRDRFDHIVTTQDWHINPAGHFAEEPDFVNTWPEHCVAASQGAQIAPRLKATLDKPGFKPTLTVKKGMFEAAYSGFEGVTSDKKTLAQALRELQVEEVFIVGIATDHCVRATALDAEREGFKVTVLKDFTVGITEESVAKTLEEELPAKGITVTAKETRS